EHHVGSQGTGTAGTGQVGGGGRQDTDRRGRRQGIPAAWHRRCQGQRGELQRQELQPLGRGEVGQALHLPGQPADRREGGRGDGEGVRVNGGPAGMAVDGGTGGGREGRRRQTRQAVGGNPRCAREGRAQRQRRPLPRLPRR